MDPHSCLLALRSTFRLHDVLLVGFSSDTIDEIVHIDLGLVLVPQVHRYGLDARSALEVLGLDKLVEEVLELGVIISRELHL